MPNGGNGAVRQRINFSKIPTVIKIPNLIAEEAFIIAIP